MDESQWSHSTVENATADDNFQTTVWKLANMTRALGSPYVLRSFPPCFSLHKVTLPPPVKLVIISSLKNLFSTDYSLSTAICSNTFFLSYSPSASYLKWNCRRFFLKEYFSSFTRLNSSVDLRSWPITRESFFASHSVILFAAHNTVFPSSFHPSKFLQKLGNSTPPSHFSYMMSLPNKSQSELFLSTAHVCFQA